MLSSVIIAKGLFLAAAGSWVTSGTLLMLVYRRLNTLNKQQAQQIRQLQQQQKMFREHLEVLRQQAEPLTIREMPVTQQIPAEQGTKNAFLQGLLQSNLKLQRDMQQIA